SRHPPSAHRPRGRAGGERHPHPLWRKCETGQHRCPHGGAGHRRCAGRGREPRRRRLHAHRAVPGAEVMVVVLLHYIVPAARVAACLFLIVVVLLQTGKGADMGAVFGGGSQTLFGSGGAGNFLTKLTTATAIIFMVTALILTYGQSRTATSNLLR